MVEGKVRRPRHPGVGRVRIESEEVLPEVADEIEVPVGGWPAHRRVACQVVEIQNLPECEPAGAHRRVRRIRREEGVEAGVGIGGDEVGALRPEGSDAPVSGKHRRLGVGVGDVDRNEGGGFAGVAVVNIDLLVGQEDGAHGRKLHRRIKVGGVGGEGDVLAVRRDRRTKGAAVEFKAEVEGYGLAAVGRDRDTGRGRLGDVAHEAVGVAVGVGRANEVGGVTVESDAVAVARDRAVQGGAVGLGLVICQTDPDCRAGDPVVAENVGETVAVAGHEIRLLRDIGHITSVGADRRVVGFSNRFAAAVGLVDADQVVGIPIVKKNVSVRVGVGGNQVIGEGVEGDETPILADREGMLADIEGGGGPGVETGAAIGQCVERAFRDEGDGSGLEVGEVDLKDEGLVALRSQSSGTGAEHDPIAVAADHRVGGTGFSAGHMRVEREQLQGAVGRIVKEEVVGGDGGTGHEVGGV